MLLAESKDKGEARGSTKEPNLTQTTLLIGDSISAGYQSVVRGLLEPDGVEVTWQVGGSSA